MAIAETIVSIVSNFIVQIFALGLVTAIIFYKLGIRSKEKAKIINRSEIIKKKLIKTMKLNKSKLMILEQKGNVIGLSRNIGYYVVEEGKNIFCLLYNPKLFWKIPQFWNSNILIVSSDYLKPLSEPTEKPKIPQYTDIEGLGLVEIVNLNNPKPKKKRSLFNRNKATVKKQKEGFRLNDDYFIFEWEGLNLSLEDDLAKKFINNILKLDESEISSSIAYAQSQRLSTVDFSEVFKPYSSAIYESKKEEGK
jgi:hypothetical protein